MCLEQLYCGQEIDPAGALEHQRAVGDFLNEPDGLAGPRGQGEEGTGLIYPFTHSLRHDLLIPSPARHDGAIGQSPGRGHPVKDPGQTARNCL